MNEGRSIERAILCPDLQRAGEADLRAYDRVYFGNEFCPRLLPSPDDLRALARLAGAAGKPVSLTTPPLADPDFPAFDALLAVLDEVLPGAEVVANDWGAIRRAGRDHPGHGIVAGRLLHRTMRDPAGTARGSHLAHPEAAEFLAGLQVTRIEADGAVCGPLPLPLSLYGPFVALSTTRSCPLASFVSDPDSPPLPGAACYRECRQIRATIRRGAGPPLVLAGNTLFYERSRDATQEDDGARRADGLVIEDRRVIEPWIPM